MLTDDDVRARLRVACGAAGGQRAFARKHGLSQGFIGQVATGLRPASDTVLALLGLKRITRIVEIEKRDDDGGESRNDT